MVYEVDEYPQLVHLLKPVLEHPYSYLLPRHSQKVAVRDGFCPGLPKGNLDVLSL